MTSAETKRSILRAVGVTPDTAAQLNEAIEERRRREQSRLVPPCLVLSENARPRQFPITAESGAPVQVVIRDESGNESHLSETAIDKRIQLPDTLPLGYYDVTVTSGERGPEQMRLILTPDRAWEPEGLRAAGIAVSLYGVRSRRNWGCGDFRDLRDLADWAAEETGAGYIGLNPLHAIHNRRPFNTSPYLPNSVFFQNFIYLDIEAIEDFQTSRRAQQLWNSPATQLKIEALRNSETVEYEEVHAWKLRFLKLAFLEFLRKRDRGSEFQDYLGREGDLLDRFATYCALDEYLHKRDPNLWLWTDWPPAFREPASSEVARFHKKHWRSVLFYKYMQWQLDLQLAQAQAHARERLPIGLYHDLALATDRFGSDLWAHREFFISGCRVGSPPDGFSPKGQDWAFPPPNSRGIILKTAIGFLLADFDPQQCPPRWSATS